MESFNATVAENPKVVMIHVSLDQDEDAAENWAAQEQFPWYTVMNKYVERSGLREHKTTRYVGELTLINADGENLGSGKKVFEQVKELTK